MGTLDGHHALVTGGGTGIGAAIARALAAEGASLSLVGRRRGPLEKVAASLSNATAITADVTRESDCASMIEASHTAHGPLDIVVANAGSAESMSARRMDLAHWQRMLDVNLTGAFLTARFSLDDLCRAADNGTRARRLIFVASTAGLKGYPYVAAYCAAKHGVVGLARALGAELAAKGVTVNAVCPGFTETPLLDASIANIVATTGRAEAAARAELAHSNPQQRFISVAEVAATVAFLASPAASAINGQAISISGGEV